MKKTLLTVVCAALALTACGRKAHPPASGVEPPAPAAAAPAAQTPAPVAVVDSAQADPERARKQGLLDYATMEDGYINDPRAQWAVSAKASSTFGDGDGGGASDVNKAVNVVGAVDGKTWTNNSQNIGFDWLQTDYAKPVHATEVRVVFQSGEGVEAVSKIEVQDTDGAWTTVWSGLSDAHADERGSRSWFVRKFSKTEKPVKSVKVTIANNVQSGYKVVDAMQLVGD